MEIKEIAVFRSPFGSKFGVPRQSGIVGGLEGRIEFCAGWRNADAIRGIEDFDYLWLIWGFSENVGAMKHALVRPPRLGGNRQMGVWATRSSFRPNNLALSAVRIVRVDHGAENEPVIYVSGADLMDGTPIYDIKPYLPFTDSHPGARHGFVEQEQWNTLTVEIPAALREEIARRCDVRALTGVLEQDPRPQYHDDPERIYGMPFGGLDIRFRVCGGRLTVVEAKAIGAE